MNKLLMTAAALLIATSVPAIAQPPQELIATDLVKLQPGEPKTYEFASSVNRIGTSAEGVIVITPHTDRTFTFQGVAPGQAMVVAQGSDGEIIHRMMVEVAYAGTLIKIYRPNDENGYTSHICTPHGCGRPNPDVKVPTPQSVQITETNRTKNGGSVSITKTY